MVIDIHTHNFRGRERQLAEEARLHGIERYVLLGDVLRDGAQPNEDQVRQINDDTLAEVRRASPHACGFCFLNPALPEEFLRLEIRRCLSLAEFRGVKLEISVPCSDSRLSPIMEELLAFGAPLLQHTWYKTEQKYAGESDPRDVAALARRWPRNRIVMAHLCGCGHRGVEDIAECPNVYVDTSGAQPEAGLVEYAVRRIGARRLLYGSDAPCRDFAAQLAKVREADLREDDRERIFHLNAEELLKW
ncbi:MAG: amidohydrolase family protein [Victivallales bacterium]|nr:amidohydrolase family protein [Victivallales bacterium]